MPAFQTKISKKHLKSCPLVDMKVIEEYEALIKSLPEELRPKPGANYTLTHPFETSRSSRTSGISSSCQGHSNMNYFGQEDPGTL